MTGEPNKVCSECGAHAIGGWYTTPLCQSCFHQRGFFGSKNDTHQMTDITRKLELIANLRPKEMWPKELGPEFGETNNWCTALSNICAEALAEITRLRTIQERRKVGLSDYPRPPLGPAPAWARISPHLDPEWPSSEPTMSNQDKAFVAAHMPLRPPTDEPKPEPWGSAFAMNTENWK